MATRRGTRELTVLAALQGADVLVIGEGAALAVQYAPGATPVVLAAATGRAVTQLCWAAQESEIPLVEHPEVTAEAVKGLHPNEEIPTGLYRPVAQALALVQKAATIPHLAKIVRPLPKQPGWLIGYFKERAASALDALPIAVVALELGADVAQQRDAIAAALAAVNQRLAADLGLLLPPVAVRAGSGLKANGFRLRLREVTAQEGELEVGAADESAAALLAGKVRALVVAQAHRLLGYAEVETLLEQARRQSPGLVKELFPRHVTVAALRTVLRNLLREGLSIRDLVGILEAILDALSQSRDPDVLTEYVRLAFSRALCGQYLDETGHLNVLLLGPEVERMIAGAVRESEGARWLDLDPSQGLAFLEAVGDGLRDAREMNLSPVLLASPQLRRFVRRVMEVSYPDVPVLSYGEIAPLVPVRSVGVVTSRSGGSPSGGGGAAA